MISTRCVRDVRKRMLTECGKEQGDESSWTASSTSTASGSDAGEGDPLRGTECDCRCLGQLQKSVLRHRKFSVGHLLILSSWVPFVQAF